MERVPLNLSHPDNLKLTPAQWRIITPENIDQVWQDIQAAGADVVLFALSPDGYEQLAVDFAAIRNHMATQRTIIMKYKEYYEPQKP